MAPSDLPSHLGRLTTDQLRALLAEGAPVAGLVPVGSVEPHGPHLPLETDTVIGEAASLRAVARLRQRGVVALLAPPVSYGVTRFADGFAGAVTVPDAILSSFLRAIVAGLLDSGLSHVCLVNNHLEPQHDAAVRAAVEGAFDPGRTSVACPLTRRWARTLSPEFKSGACHAGRYETSLMLAAAPGSVDEGLSRSLEDLTVSLSDGIRAGKTSFREMGMDRAYTGSPREASAVEGAELLDRLAEMIVTEVAEALGLAAPSEARR